ncbi:MAG: glycosyltransferase [Bacteroidales bacterium]
MNGSGIDIAWYSFIFLVPYLFVIVRVCQGLSRIEPSYPRPASSVKVSVIITTCRSPEASEDLLSDLTLQIYNHNAYEVIIADDSGGSWEMYTQKADLPGFRVVPNRGSGKKGAIDTAISEAEGELIITTDDDCRVGKDWILAIASHYKMSKAGMIICPVELTGNNSLFSKLQQLEFISLQGVTAGSALLGDPLLCNGAGLAFRRDLYPGLEQLPGSDMPSGDDIFFLHYLKRKGIPVEWVESESATVRTEVAGTISGFIRQRSRWASKSLFYNDPSTIFAGLAVLLACAITATYIVLSFIDPVFIRTAVILLLVKSIPDSLVIINRLRFHNRTDLIWYFPVAQLIYPFYALISVFGGLFSKKKW